MLSNQTTMTKFEDLFSYEVWDTTYRNSEDKTIDDTLRRVARAIATPESTPELREYWEEQFYDMLTDFKCTVGGRIYANAGAGWSGTSLLNCFVSPRSGEDIDSIEGILADIGNQCKTLKSEGGWGQNFSFIRPRGSFIHGVGVESPGAVKFMEIYDKTSDVITSGSGQKASNAKAKKKIRKGAQMAVLDCFSKDTEISTPDGWINVVDIVEAIQEGKDVYVLCENGDKHIAKNAVIRPKSQLYLVETEDGTKVEVTGDHKFVVQNQVTGEEYLKAIKDVDPEVEYLQVL